MKIKKVILLCFLLMVVMGTSVFAAEGDIYNKGNSTLYEIPGDINSLIADAVDSSSSDDFYKELDNGNYKSITEMEEAKNQAIVSVLSENDVNMQSSDEILEFIKSNGTEIMAARNEAVSEVEEKTSEELGVSDENSDDLEVIGIY